MGVCVNDDRMFFFFDLSLPSIETEDVFDEEGDLI